MSVTFYQTLNKRKRLLFLIISSILPLSSVMSQPKAKHTVSGYVYDRSSRETLIGASVFDRISEKGAASNNYGFYSIALPEGEVDLRASYVGYGAETRRFNLVKDTTINLSMDASAMLDEVVVEAQSRRRSMTDVLDASPGAIRISPAVLRTVPAFMGEVDLVKALQQTPGVSSGTEGFSGMYVRGGNRDENLYLIDGNPVYDVNHLFGLFSTFNPDAIKSAEFYKGSFPARFGGRLSSVVNVRTKDGNMQDYHGTFTVGLISSKIQLEGPIVKDRASFNVAFRRTYLDLILTPALWIVNARSKDEKNYASYHFYDLNAKLNYRFSDRSRMYINWYSGEDAFRIKQKWYYNSTVYDFDKNDIAVETDDRVSSYSENGAGWKWGNMLASLNWNYVFSPQLFANISAIYSRFHSDINIYDMSVDKANDVETDRSRTEMIHNSGIRDIGYRMDFDYSPHPNHTVRFGSNYLFHTFRPEESGTLSLGRTGDAADVASDRLHGRELQAHELSLYAEDDMDITSALKVNAGLHFSLFHVEKKTYAGLQPRLSARYLLGRDWSVKASYAMMNQYVHLLSASTISLPNDLWVPVTRNIRPMISNQFSTGVYHELNRTWHFSLEGYWKAMNHVIEYRDGASMFSASTEWQDRVAMGRGTAYGIEWLVQKPEGRLNGWLGYGLSWADRRFPNGEVNGGRRFWAKYDSRHKINLAAGYKLSDRVDVNGTWTYYTGGWMTVGLESYDRSPVLPGESVSQQTGYSPYRDDIKHYESRNNYRMSDYHRLDLGLNIHRPKKNGHTGMWSISIYNVYARKNPSFAFPGTENVVDANGNVTQKPVIQEISILSFIPSISYTYTF